MKTLSEIKERLQANKPLLVAQQQYLINVVLNLEQGIPADFVIEHTKITPIPGGSLTSGYSKAKVLQNAELKKAVNLLDGADYTRCQKLESIIKNVKRQFKLGGFKPSNDIEHIIFQLLKSGLKPPASTRYLYELLF